MMILAVCCAASSAAQSRPITLGDRVRVLAPKAGYPSLTGTVVSTTPDVLALTPDRSTTEVAVARNQIDRLYRSIATRTNTAKGTFIGAVLFGGGAIWFGPKSSTRTAPTIESGSGSTRNVIVGAAIGAGFGALIGHFVKSDTWVSVPPSGP